MKFVITEAKNSGLELMIFGTLIEGELNASQPLLVPFVEFKIPATIILIRSETERNVSSSKVPGDKMIMLKPVKLPSVFYDAWMKKLPQNKSELTLCSESNLKGLIGESNDSRFYQGVIQKGSSSQIYSAYKELSQMTEKDKNFLEVFKLAIETILSDLKEHPQHVSLYGNKTIAMYIEELNAIRPVA